jgi:hypothetical protein
MVLTRQLPERLVAQDGPFIAALVRTLTAQADCPTTSLDAMKVPFMTP